jgi:hypothetical protein
MTGNPLFWAYANVAFEALVVFILPLGFAVRELILLRRDERASAGRGSLEAASPAEAHEAVHAAALAVEQDEALAAAMKGWEEATVGDGLRRIAR